MLIGAGVGAGTALLSGNDWKTGAMVGAGTAGAGSAMTSNPFTTEALKAGATNQASTSMMMHPTLTAGANSGVTSAGVSGVNNSVMQNPDFIGSHLTDDFNSQMLTNNTAGTYTDGVIDPMQAYPSFDKPIIPTADELAEANGGYGGVFDSFGDTMGAIGDFTGLDRGDVAQTGMITGAQMLANQQQQKPIEHAPVNQGISKPQVNTKFNDGLLSSFPNGGANQLTPEQIEILKNRGII